MRGGRSDSRYVKSELPGRIVSVTGQNYFYKLVADKIVNRIFVEMSKTSCYNEMRILI